MTIIEPYSALFVSTVCVGKGDGVGSDVAVSVGLGGRVGVFVGNTDTDVVVIVGCIGADVAVRRTGVGDGSAG